MQLLKFDDDWFIWVTNYVKKYMHMLSAAFALAPVLPLKIYNFKKTSLKCFPVIKNFPNYVLHYLFLAHFNLQATKMFLT